MLVIPAIDIKDGRCVRLYQGDMERETVYYDRPLDAARRLVDEGAQMIHVVDLNGAVAGRPVHLAELAAVCAESGVPVEAGGGLRTLEDIGEAVAAGAATVVGIDARAGRAAVRGWREDTAMDAVDLARRCAEDGACRIIYTDISRDGTGSGVNAEQTVRVARAVETPVVASGGVGSVEDIRTLARLEGDGVEGVIVGRALYRGAFSLAEAMEAAGGPHAH